MDNSNDQSLLIVDDDERFRERLALSFRRKGYRVTTAESPAQAIEVCRTEAFDAAVVDLCMPDGNGLELIGDLGKIQPESRILILTGYGSVSTAKEALRQGAVDYLMKPADAEEIEAALYPPEDSPDRALPQEMPVPTLERVQWEHIQRVLTDTGNNVSEAARRLGIERRTLQRKLRKYPPNR